MRVGILSFRPPDRRIAYEESRIVKAARELGYMAKVYRAHDCELYYNGHGPEVLYKGKKFPKVDVIIPRVSVLVNVDLRASIVKQFELLGVPVLNDYNSILKAKNKLKTLQILSHFGIPLGWLSTRGGDCERKGRTKRCGDSAIRRRAHRNLRQPLPIAPFWSTD